ncbi:MAG: twin-arginine translocation signal domain-containing protein, partial [Eggerthellaceae bacterium]|nr:twin-arginine translocation signal domain-containing protein [Eggerthellaceae bacterium]
MSEKVKGGFLSRRGFLKAAGATAAVGAMAGGMSSTSGWLAPAKAVAAPEEKVAYTFHNMHCMGNCMFECTVRDGRLAKVAP